MIASQNRSFNKNNKCHFNIWIVLITVIFFCFPGYLSSAQEGSPIDLIPELKDLKRTNDSSTKQYLKRKKQNNDSLKVIRPAIANITKKGVQIDTLGALNSNEVGALMETDGALGFELWNGTPLSLVVSLLPKLPVTVNSLVMKNLMRRLLLSPAKKPKGHIKDNWLILTRIKTLMALGDLVGARRLLEAIPNFSENSELVRLSLETSLLSGNYSKVCGRIPSKFQSDFGFFWQKVLNFCRIIKGGKDKAALGLSLMREAGVEDKHFMLLADALISGEVQTIKTFPKPSPLHLAMIGVSKVVLPMDIISSNDANVARIIASDPRKSLTLRLKAAEQANNLGVFSADKLRKVFDELKFSEIEIEKPLSYADVRFGPRIRGLLYYAAKKQSIPSIQAEAIARALSLGRYEKRYFSTVNIFGVLIQNLRPAKELAWFAAEAIRALLILGDFDKARSWYKLVANMANSSAAEKKVLNLVNPIARIAGLSNGLSQETNLFDLWLRAEGAQKSKSDVLFHINDSVGFVTPEEIWLKSIDGVPRTGVVLPDFVIWNRLQGVQKLNLNYFLNKRNNTLVDSVNDKSLPKAKTDKIKSDLESENSIGGIGEVILLAMVAIGNNGPASADPVVLGSALRALISVGLRKEALSLALEILLVREL